MSITFTNPSDHWIAAGFTTATTLANPGASNLLDRFSNNGGVSWFLYRNSTVAGQDVQAFGGPNATNNFANLDLTTDFNAPHIFRIDLTTSLDGLSYKSQIFMDGSSLAGPLTINRAITEVKNVGLSYDNTGATSPSYHNFSLTATPVPEPGTVALLSLAGASILWMRRRQSC